MLVFKFISQPQKTGTKTESCCNSLKLDLSISQSNRSIGRPLVFVIIDRMNTSASLYRIATCLKWLPSFALHIPTAHDFCVISACKWARAHVQNVIDFPQTKLNSEVNARFLVNEHCDPHLLFYKFNENNILNNWEKHWQKSMATFLANEVNATERDVTGPTEQVQIMCS